MVFNENESMIRIELKALLQKENLLIISNPLLPVRFQMPSVTLMCQNGSASGKWL